MIFYYFLICFNLWMNDLLFEDNFYFESYIQKIFQQFKIVFLFYLFYAIFYFFSIGSPTPMTSLFSILVVMSSSNLIDSYYLTFYFFLTFSKILPLIMLTIFFDSLLKYF